MNGIDELIRRAEAMPHRMAEISISGHPDVERAMEVFRDLERAARCLVSGAEVESVAPDLPRIRVGLAAYSDLLTALLDLHTIAPIIAPETGYDETAPAETGDPF